MNPASPTEARWRVHPRAIFWAAAGGLGAALVTGFIAHMRGMLTGIPAGLVGSDSVGVGWLVHLAAGLVVGAAYGLLVATRSYAKGALYGAIYGAVVGIVLVLVLGNLLTTGGVPLDVAGAMQVAMHVFWGALVGLIQASGLRADRGDTFERPRYRAV